MPAILRNVAKTDTLETQRQKINLLAQDVYDLGGGSGGGGLSGTFSLSNGTRFAPSLNFTNQQNTGLFLYGNSLSVSSVESETARFNGDDIRYYKTTKIQNAEIDALVIQTEGFGYQPKEYENISVSGGSGSGALVDVTVSPFVGSITNAGSGYIPGTYTNVPLSGGSGSNAEATVTVRGIVGTITSGGSGYTNATYADVPLSGGNGTGARATLVVTGGAVTTVTITNNGSGYLINNVLSVNNSDLAIPISQGGGTSGGSGFQFTISQSPYVVSNVTPTSNGKGGYVVGNVLSAANTVIGASTPVGTITNAGTGYTNGTYTNIDVYNVPTTTYIVTSVPNPNTPPPVNVYSINGNIQQSLTFTIGNTYRFDLSNVSNDTHPFLILAQNYQPTPDGIQVITKGTPGSTGAFVDVIIGTSVPNNTVLVYSCAAHPGMGSTITCVTGSAGRYGYSAKASLVVSSGSVTSFTITKVGFQYKATDTVSILSLDVGGTGSGFVYTINTASTGSGSGFQYTLSEVGSITLADVRSSGDGYQLEDVLTPSIPFTYKIKSYGYFSSFKFWIDKNDGLGYVQTPTLNLYRGYTYIFDYSDQSNLPHAFNVSVTQDGIHNGGTIFTDGVTVDPLNKTVTLVVSNSTPSTLYYYCAVQASSHSGEGGTINVLTGTPAQLTTAEILIDEITNTNAVTLNLDGSIVSSTLTADSAFLQSAILSSNLSVGNLSLSGTTINTASGNLNLSSAADFYINGGTGKNLYFKNGITDLITVDLSTGDIETEGNISILNNSYLTINEKLKIDNTLIEEIVDVPLTGNGVGITLKPDANKSVFVDATSSFKIPVGSTADRPLDSTQGSVRYNTTTNQYEGYNGTSWASLGGVRDIDGNTYILAESSAGANENILYFYNNSKNTLQISETDVSFYNARNITAYDIDGLLPWQSNTAYALNVEIYTATNVYRVISSGGTTGLSAPTHTSGSVTNGTANLLWLRSVYSDITFSSFNTKLNINTPTYYNNGIVISTNSISTVSEDLTISPYAGKKVNISATTSLVLPSGNSSQRGAPSIGSVRYNTDFLSFEGYNGTNWTSLGGVKDVDGNTYIIPESAPGANENILYFYNNGNNTLRVTETELLFKTIDNISSDSNNLDINTQTLGLNNLAFTIDTSSSTTVKLLSTYANVDFAISSGLTSDTLLRLNSSGDLLINKSYSTGSTNFIKILDNELKTFELDDIKTETTESILVKGTTDFTLFTLFDPSIHNGAKVILVANNQTTNDKEIIEFNITSKGSDIYHTEYGNITTGNDQMSVLFDFDPSNNVRLTATLDTLLSSGNNVHITCIKTIFKK